MAGKGGKKGKGKKGKEKNGSTPWSDTVAVILRRDCAEALYAALVIALGTLPTPKKKKKKKDKGKKSKTKSKGKGKDGGGKGKGGKK
ncbi:MAG TPA: hypothetical protein VGK82_16145 [Pyrinomonadaceae bacterium]